MNALAFQKVYKEYNGRSNWVCALKRRKHHKLNANDNNSRYSLPPLTITPTEAAGKLKRADDHLMKLRKWQLHITVTGGYSFVEALIIKDEPPLLMCILFILLCFILILPCCIWLMNIPFIFSFIPIVDYTWPSLESNSRCVSKPLSALSFINLGYSSTGLYLLR